VCWAVCPCTFKRHLLAQVAAIGWCSAWHTLIMPKTPDSMCLVMMCTVLMGKL
jgi:hypothetical protein